MDTLSLLTQEEEANRLLLTKINMAKADKEQTREGEEKKTWFRTDRTYCIQDDAGKDVWYFLTRENVAVGPYPSLKVAEIEVQLLIVELQATESTEEALSAIHKFNKRDQLRLQ